MAVRRHREVEAQRQSLIGSSDETARSDSFEIVF
jgi:hypothetical protein